MRLLVAPDAFKGTFRAPEVAAAIGRGIEAAGFEPPDLCPIADGGEGTMEALVIALGGETAGAPVRDPLGREIRAGFALLEDGATAVVEVAEASGLGLVAEHERDAEAATTHGTGDLIAAAVDAGAGVVLVAVGGSATTDGGAGAIEALREAGGLRNARPPDGRARACDRRPGPPGRVRQAHAGPPARARGERRARPRGRGLGPGRAATLGDASRVGLGPTSVLPLAFQHHGRRAHPDLAAAPADRAAGLRRPGRRPR